MRKIDPIKHEGRRQQILDAAGRCFARDGFRGASISDICAEAKMSSGHVYHYFASKEAIISALTEGRLAIVATRLERMTQNPDLIDAFTAEKSAYSEAQQLMVLDMLAEAGRNPAIANILRAHSREVRLMVATVLRKAQESGQVDPSLDADLTAAVLLAIADGTKAMRIRDPKLSKTGSKEHVKALVTRFLKPPV